MSGKPTPGPWSSRRIGPRLGPVRLTSKTFVVAPQAGPAFAYLPEGRDDIQEANARLIASAPEMYDFIKRIESGETFGIASPATAARALLAKIDGGS